MAIATTTAHARVIMQGSERPEYDCNQGCPASTSPVCAEGDITLQSACLAHCQKLTLKHRGPCDIIDGHGRVSGPDAVVAAFAPASSIPDASTASTPMQISTRAMNRFKSDGFVCIGRAVSSPDFKPRRSVLRNSSMPLRRPLPGPHDLRVVRVYAKDNLMYIEQASDTAARLASAITPEIMASTPPVGEPGSSEAPVGAAQEDGGRCIPKPFGTVPAQADVTPAEVPADKVIMYNAAYPYAAIGRLDINGGTCSGSQIGDYTVLTAAHCYYDRKTKTYSRTNWRYQPATYRDSRGIRQYPYPTNPASYVSYFNSWINEASDRKAWWYDILVVTLKNKRRTGTLGLTYDPAGFGGNINWAGYPSDTQSTGTFRWGNCNIVNDGNGKDSRLVLRGANSQCLILEHGESSAPLFDSDYGIRAVESHGEPLSNGGEIDVGTELDKVNYDFVVKHKVDKPK